MKNDRTGSNAGRNGRTATRPIRYVPIRFLLAAWCAIASIAAESQEKFLLEGIVDAEGYETNQGSYSLSRNEGDPAGLGRLQAWSAWQISPALQWYAFAELESDNSTGSWETDAELQQFALRYSAGSSPYYIIEAGKILPPIAMFSERNLSTENPLISRPDFLYATYPLGIRLTGSADWLDYRAALVDKPVINPDYLPANPDAAFRPDLGLGVTPLQGLRFGLAYTKGPYLSKQVNEYLPANSNWKDFDQRLWAFEFHFSRGYAEFNAELVLARYDIPLQDAPMDVVDYFAEFKYTWTPRIYAAVRLQRNQYPFISESSYMGLSVADVTIRDFEIGLGYRFSADTQIKVAYKADSWSVEDAPGVYYPSGRSLGLQLSHHFDVKSWFSDTGRVD